MHLGVAAGGGVEGAWSGWWLGEVGVVPAMVGQLRVAGWSVGSGVGFSGAGGGSGRSVGWMMRPISAVMVGGSW